MKYPKLNTQKKLRRVSDWNDEKKSNHRTYYKPIYLVTKHNSELNKSRWQVELFFRQIKQLIHINSFIGKSENLVITQIWTALITILMLKAQSKFGSHLSNLLVFIWLNLFEKIEIQK